MDPIQSAATALRDSADFRKLQNHIEVLATALDVGLMIIDSNGVVAFASERALALAGASDISQLTEKLGVLDVSRANRSSPSHTARTTIEIGGSAARAVLLQLELHEIVESDHREFLGVLRDVATLHASEMDSRHAAFLRGFARLAPAAAHDVRAPLNSIALNLELLRNTFENSTSDVDDRRKKISGIMDSEIRRLDDMVQRLLSHPLLEADAREAFDLHALVRDLHSMLVPYCRAHRIQLQLVTAEAPIMVEGNRDAIKHAMTNIIVNGLEAMPAGGTLELSLRSTGNKAVFSVTDTGLGISPELSRRLFIRYTTTKESGAGSGLYVARRVIDGHGGEIRMKSEVGRGSCFEIELPSAAH